MIYIADFESRNSDMNILEEKTSIWLFDICNIKTLEHFYGFNIKDFISKCEELAPSIIYFHNLKFDIQFILYYLFEIGYTVNNDKKAKAKTFQCLINDVGSIYSIKVCFKKVKGHEARIIEFRDSLKKINGTVRQIAEAYHLPISKGEIDYRLNRDENYIATKEEIDYVKRDTEIIARVMNLLYEKDMTKLTSSGDTFYLYKKHMGFNFKYFFPELDIELDNYFRKSYRGGVCQVNEKYKNKILHSDYVYDVNSMYPAQMCKEVLPYGTPIFFKGEYIFDIKMPLYIIHINVDCKLKDGFRPTVLLNKGFFSLSNEYLIDTKMEMIELYLTSVDFEIFKKHYDIFEIEYIDGYKFYGSRNLFKSFIDPIYERKCNSIGAEKQLNKLLLNSLYGKFATNPRHIDKIPFLDSDGKLKYKVIDDILIGKTYYVAVASFITSYARKQLFEAIQNNYDSFIYCDTDSIHLTTEAKNIEIDSKKIGAWKLETANNIVITAKYIGTKAYYQIFKDDSNNIKLAGCPDNVKNKIKLEDFKYGSVFSGKLLPKLVNGGVVLVDTEFTIKERR